jgi:DNA-binding MarR family transcriptional regulator
MQAMHHFRVQSCEAVPFVPSSTEEAVLVALMQAGRRLRQRHLNSELDPAAMPLLHALRCAGSIRLSDLAARTHLDASTVSRHVKALEDRRFVERSGDPVDRRASQVTLRPEGEKALLAAMDERRADVADVLSGWSQNDRRRLADLLTRLARDLAEIDERDARRSNSMENR